MCPGRPASVPLHHTIARSVPAAQHSRKWLDGVSDALAYPKTPEEGCVTLQKPIKPGDRVYVQDFPPCALEVVDCSQPSIVTLKSEHGATLKVGRLFVIPASNPGKGKA